MSIEDTLTFWHRERGLKIGSRSLVHGRNGLAEILAIEERGEYLDVTVRDTETRRITVETIKREAKV